MRSVAQKTARPRDSKLYAISCARRERGEGQGWRGRKAGTGSQKRRESEGEGAKEVGRSDQR
eukprot:1987346-Rhodomonas_salina.1